MSAINQHPSAIDRAGELRSNWQALSKLWESAEIIQICNGRLATNGGALIFFNSEQVAQLELSKEFKTGSRFFLGLNKRTQVPYFAWDTDWQLSKSEDEQKIGFGSLRELGAELSEVESEIALHAIALSNWHKAHPRCPQCGGATRIDLGGAARYCEVDQSQHHPRTDSAVIVLIRDRQDRILLGHQPVWPEGRFSTFAGFLEPGETFEQCVAREVFEEAGVTLTDINYLGSQPWPFPASIMVAFDAITDQPERARPDGEEITEVRWFTRAELKAAALDATLLLPPKISVARKMIERWLGESAIGGELWR